MNGRELTADDVVYNIERWRTSDQNTRYPAMSWESVTATDRYTVEVKLVDPPLDALSVLIDDNIGFVNAPATRRPARRSSSTATSPTGGTWSVPVPSC